MIYTSPLRKSSICSSRSLTDRIEQPREFLYTTLSARESRETGWGRFFLRMQKIQAFHQEYNDAETPQLPNAVMHGTRRLLDVLQKIGYKLPTIMVGTCDATITLEWHDAFGPGTFRSLDVLSENEAEEYLHDAPGRHVLRTVTF